MFYIRISTIFLVLALIILIVLAVYACFVVSGWWSRKEEQEESCRNCPGNVKGRCDCLRKKKNPCETCWEKAYKTCEGCHRRSMDEK